MRARLSLLLVVVLAAVTLGPVSTGAEGTDGKIDTSLVVQNATEESQNATEGGSCSVFEANGALTANEQFEELQVLESEYCRALTAVRANITALGNVSETVADADTLGGNATQSLEDLQTSWATFQVAADEIRNEIYETMAQYFLPPEIRTELREAMNSVEAERGGVADNATAALDGYEASLDEVEDDAQSDVRRTLGLGFLTGLVLGAVLGGIIPWRRGSEAKDFYQVSSDVEYELGVLKLPLIGAAVTLLVGVGTLVLWGMPEVLV